MFKQLLIEHNRLRLTFGLFRPMASSLRLIPPKIDLERMYFMQRAPASTVALSPTLILPDPKRTRDGSTAETWRGSRSRRRKRNLWIKLSYGANFLFDSRVLDIECYSPCISNVRALMVSKSCEYRELGMMRTTTCGLPSLSVAVVVGWPPPPPVDSARRRRPWARGRG